MLLLLVVVLIAVTAYAIVTSNVTDQERDEMLADKEMWP